MGNHNKNWFDNYSSSSVLFYRGFCLFNNEVDVLKFFDYINARYPTIHFTMEREFDRKFSFFSRHIVDNSHPSVVTSVYRKKTFTGLLTNYFSFARLNYKLGLVRTLLDRVYKINNSWAGFHLDVKKLIFLLRKNCFPSWVIGKIIHRYLSDWAKHLIQLHENFYALL